ncbi:MAG: EamA family transporter [Chloroflexi bacterium]|nr:EamA family transporter [Chloroflexota bacterium]
MLMSRTMSRLTRGNPLALGILASFGAAACYGVSQFLTRQVLVNYGVPPLAAATFGLLTGMVVLAALSVRNLRQDVHAPRKAIFFIGVSGLAASAGVGFNYSALGMAPVSVVAPVAAVSPLVSLALTHFMLQRMERVTARIWLGAALVVGGVILVILGTA